MQVFSQKHSLTKHKSMLHEETNEARHITAPPEANWRKSNEILDEIE